MILFIAGAPNVFLKPDIYQTVSTRVPLILIPAIVLTPIVIEGEIDLSFPSIILVSMYFFTHTWYSTGNIGLSLLFCFGFGAIAGLINGFLVAKVKIQSLVTTIGMYFLWQGFLLVHTGGGATFGIQDIANTTLYKITMTTIGGFPVSLIWAAGIGIAFWFLTNRHRFGSSMYLIGDDEDTAVRLGVNTDKVKIITFLLFGIGCAASAVLYGLNYTSFNSGFGGFRLLLLITASIFIGGTPLGGGNGTLFGTAIGVLILSFINSGLVQIGFSGYWTNFVFGMVLALAILIHSIGVLEE